jgi:hypothetical protein
MSVIEFRKLIPLMGAMSVVFCLSTLLTAISPVQTPIWVLSVLASMNIAFAIVTVILCVVFRKEGT